MADLGVGIRNLEIVETSQTSLEVQAAVDFRNPTNYTADVGYFDALVAVNGTPVGHVNVENVCVGAGKNTAMRVHVTWSPGITGGDEGLAKSRELISQLYISGRSSPGFPWGFCLTHISCRLQHVPDVQGPPGQRAWGAGHWRSVAAFRGDVAPTTDRR